MSEALTEAHLTDALERVEVLESAIREAVAMGWCRESRELLWGAIEADPARVEAGLEASAGYMAEACAVLDHHENLELVLTLADRIFWEAHPTLRKAGNMRRLGEALESCARSREEAAREANWQTKPGEKHFCPEHWGQR